MDGKENKLASAKSETEVEWQPVILDKDNRDVNLRAALDAQPLFRNLSTRDWRELATLFHKRNYAGGGVIFEEGTPGLGMYVIVSGKVHIHSSMQDSEKAEIELLPGDFFGEMSLIDEIDRSATAIAVGETRLIGIFRPQIQDMMHRRLKLGLTLTERLARIVVKRLRASNFIISQLRTEVKDLEAKLIEMEERVAEVEARYEESKAKVRLES